MARPPLCLQLTGVLGSHASPHSAFVILHFRGMLLADLDGGLTFLLSSVMGEPVLTSCLFDEAHLSVDFMLIMLSCDNSFLMGSKKVVIL